MRLSKVAIFISVFLSAAASQAEERTEVHLFHYGRTNTAPRQTAFYDFRDMLVEKLPKLASELLRMEVSVPAASHLCLKSVLDENGKWLPPEEQVGSLEAKRLYWLTTGALGVLTGYVREQGEIPYAYSTFFWGQLKGPYPDEVIDLKLPLIGESFDNTYDSHSVAILYALAQESKKGCDNAAEIIKLLSEAQKRAKAVADEFPELGAQLEAIVVAAIDDIRGECSYDK